MSADRPTSEVTQEGCALVSQVVPAMIEANMPAEARLLLLTLLSCTTERRCFVPVVDLAQWTALGPRRVARWLRELQRRLWLRETGPNEYEVSLSGGGWRSARARRAAPRRHR
jgi:hypothetical protein